MLPILLLEGSNKVSPSIWHLWTLQMRWVSSYPFLQVGKLRHKWWGRDFSCLSTGKVSSCAGRWIQTFCVLVHSSSCFCKKSCVLLFWSCTACICRFASLYSPSTQFSLWFQVFPLLLLSQTLFSMKKSILPFISCPHSFLYLLIIQTLFWFIKCPARVTEVFWGPCLSRDVPLCKCHTNAESHRSWGSDQVQVIAVPLELLHFEILSHEFLLPWMWTLEGLGLGSVKNCLGLEPGLPALEESVAWSIWPKCPSGEIVWIMGLVHVAIWRLFLIIMKIIH